MAVIGRWLLYSVVGILLVVMAFGGGGDLGSDDPKGSFRSIALSVVGVVATLVGFGVFGSYRVGGPLGDYWPHVAIVSWSLAACFVVGAWFSIARDLRREAIPNNR